MGAALLEMAAAFAGDTAAATRATRLQAELLECGELELRSYSPVLQAVRLPAGDPSRAERLADALSRASETPLEIARVSTEVAELAAGIVPDSKPAVEGDAVAAVLLAEAAAQAAARLVQINLAGSPEDPRLAEVAELTRRASEARAAIRT